MRPMKIGDVVWLVVKKPLPDEVLGATFSVEPGRVINFDNTNVVVAVDLGRDALAIVPHDKVYADKAAARALAAAVGNAYKAELAEVVQRMGTFSLEAV